MSCDWGFRWTWSFCQSFPLDSLDFDECFWREGANFDDSDSGRRIKFQSPCSDHSDIVQAALLSKLKLQLRILYHRQIQNYTCSKVPSSPHFWTTRYVWWIREDLADARLRLPQTLMPPHCRSKERRREKEKTIHLSVIFRSPAFPARRWTHA